VRAAVIFVGQVQLRRRVDVGGNGIVSNVTVRTSEAIFQQLARTASPPAGTGPERTGAPQHPGGATIPAHRPTMAGSSGSKAAIKTIDVLGPTHGMSPAESDRVDLDRPAQDPRAATRRPPRGPDFAHEVHAPRGQRSLDALGLWRSRHHLRAAWNQAGAHRALDHRHAIRSRTAACWILHPTRCPGASTRAATCRSRLGTAVAFDGTIWAQRGHGDPAGERPPRSRPIGRECGPTRSPAPLGQARHTAGMGACCQRTDVESRAVQRGHQRRISSFGSWSGSPRRCGRRAQVAPSLARALGVSEMSGKRAPSAQERRDRSRHVEPRRAASAPSLADVHGAHHQQPRRAGVDRTKKIPRPAPEGRCAPSVCSIAPPASARRKLQVAAHPALSTSACGPSLQTCHQRHGNRPMRPTSDGRIFPG